MTASDKAYRELAGAIVELQKKYDGLSKAQLGRSSLEDSTLRTYDDAGQLVGALGRLPDGSYGSATLSGPVPPTPSAPQVEPVRGVGLNIVWDGFFTNVDDVVPLEGGRLEVYVSIDDDITPVLIPRYSIESPRGGQVTLAVSYNQQYYVGFAFRAASGKVSPASEIVGPFVVERANAEDLDVDFDLLRGTKIFYGPDEPVTTQADLWLKSPVGLDDQYTAWRYDPALEEWVELQDQGVVQALQAAAEANAAADEAGIAALAAQDIAGTSQQAADAAQQKANEAAQAAADAANAAIAAHGVADNAAAAAATAQSTATAANDKALEAAGLVAGKSRIYYQTSAPAVGDPNALWIDTDDGFKPYRYVAGAWSYVENASVQAAATAAGQAQTTANTAKTTADNAAAAAAAADQKAVDAAAAAVAASNLAASKNKTFNQTSAPTSGMVAGDQWIDTDDGNKRYVYTTSWVASPIGAAGISATARQLGAIVTYRQSSAPTGALAGDFWIDSDDNVIYRHDGSTWVKSQDAAINTAITNAATAQATADGKMRIFAQASAPAGLTANDVGDLWIDTDDSNVSYTWALVTGTTYGWVKRQIGNGAIVPQSLVASNVIATGSVTASLFEALMVLSTTIIAGDPAGDHARMTPTGFRVFRADPIDGVPDEVVRMGTDTNDYFGVVDAAGNLVASIDDTGGGSFSKVSTQQLYVAGRDISAALADGPRGVVARFRAAPGADIGLIYTRYGIAEVGMSLFANRTYKVEWRLTWAGNVAGDEAGFKLLFTKGADNNTSAEAPSPDINSPELAAWLQQNTNQDRWISTGGTTTFVPSATSRHRILLTAERGAGSQLGTIRVVPRLVELVVTDVGPATNASGNWNGGGGQLFGSGGATAPPPSVTQQYFVDLGPAGRASYQGNGQYMNWAGNDIYQGWNSTNGDTRGQVWFNLPNITGTVDRVDLYLYFRHWYFNSGGTAILNISDQRGGGPNPYKFKGDWYVGGWPKPGGREVMLPSDWWPLFRGTNNDNYNGRATCITLGPGNGTNQSYYGVATDARLRIYYTQ